MPRRWRVQMDSDDGEVDLMARMSFVRSTACHYPPSKEVMSSPLDHQPHARLRGEFNRRGDVLRDGRIDHVARKLLLVASFALVVNHWRQASIALPIRPVHADRIIGVEARVEPTCTHSRAASIAVDGLGGVADCRWRQRSEEGSVEGRVELRPCLGRRPVWRPWNWLALSRMSRVVRWIGNGDLDRGGSQGQKAGTHKRRG